MLTLMRIEFSKMQGLGNDFFVFDAPPSADMRLDPEQLRALADRHTGVGFDQALMLGPPRDARSRVFYRVFNADGTEVEQCGNGARCVAALLYARAPALGREMAMDSAGGAVHARVREDGLVSVDMGVPNFDPRALPMSAPCRSAIRTRSCAWATSPAHRFSTSVPRSSITRHFRIEPTWASCRSSIAATFACASMNAAQARPWPAAPEPAPRSRSDGATGCSARTSASICRAAGRRFPGPARHSMSG